MRAERAVYHALHRGIARHIDIDRRPLRQVDDLVIGQNLITCAELFDERRVALRCQANNFTGAALGLSQLKKLATFLELRSEVARKYIANLGHLPLTLPKPSDFVQSTWHLFPIMIDAAHDLSSKVRLFQFLVDNEIHVSVHYAPIYLQPLYSAQGFRRGYCPNAEDYFMRGISLPIFCELSDGQQDYVVNKISEWFRNESG